MGCSWQKAHGCVMGFRKELQGLHYQEIHKEFVGNMATHIDNKVLGLKLEDPEESPYGFASKYLHERHKREPGYFDLVFFPFRHGIYGISFTSQNSNTWTDIWFSKDLVEEYRYWNNTDRPGGISQALWDLRGQVWDEILADFGSVPSMCGYTAQCLEKYPPMIRTGDLIPHIPTFEARVKNASFTTLSNRWRRESKDPNPYNFFGWVKENQDQLDQEKARVSSLLVLDITSEITRST
jgi:hypothetical protein